MRKVKAALRRVANARKAHAASAPAKKETGLLISEKKLDKGFRKKDPTPNTFKTNISAFDAKMRGARAPIAAHGFPGVAVALRGRASRETSFTENDTLSAESLSESHERERCGDGGDRPPVPASSTEGTGSEFELDPTGFEFPGQQFDTDTTYFTHEEETMFIDVLMQNERLMAQNETLRDEVFKGSAESNFGEAGSGNENVPLLNIEMMADGFVNRPEMHGAELVARAEDLLHSAWVDTLRIQEAVYPATKRLRRSRADAAADQMELQNNPVPAGVCETVLPAHANRRRRFGYAFRLVCFLFTVGFVILGFSKLWTESGPTLCDAKDGDDKRSMWSIPVMLVRLMGVTTWSVSCGMKRSSLGFAWLTFAIMWHALCLQAWLGFRFARAYLLMYRLERRHAAAATRSTLDAKREALRGSKLSRLIPSGSLREGKTEGTELSFKKTGNAPGSRETSAVVAGLWSTAQPWGRRVSDGGSVTDSEGSFTDSALGEHNV